MSRRDKILTDGLPVDIDAERFILGSVMLDDTLFLQVSGNLRASDFAIEKHRRIFHRMTELYERSERIDRVSVANELRKHNQLESCDGLTYLTTLDDGLPRTSNVDGYVRIVREKATLRNLIFTGQKLVDQCMLGQDSPREILSDTEETLLRINGDALADRSPSVREIISRFDGGINSFLDPAKQEVGHDTGFLKFDMMTGGLHPGELVIVAARPGMGKTAFALNVAQHMVLSTEPKAVAVFSYEMSKEALLMRLVCGRARVDSRHFKLRQASSEERIRLLAAATELERAPLYIDDRASLGLVEIHSQLRKIRQETGNLALGVIDYLQLMPVRSVGENRNQEVSGLSRGLKLIAKDVGIPLLVVSQLSRAPEIRLGDHRPQLSDLRESGSIEQDADLVAFIFREELYKPEREDLRGMAELILSKQRNGPTGMIPLVFLRQYTRFENLARDLDSGVVE